MNEIFKRECEELGIPFEEFPWDFAEGSTIKQSVVFDAMLWILKKRQDKMMGILMKRQDKMMGVPVNWDKDGNVTVVKTST